MKRDQRRDQNHIQEKCCLFRPQLQLHRLCTEQLQGIQFYIGHDVAGPQELCDPTGLPGEPRASQSLWQSIYQQVRVDFRLSGSDYIPF